ncbi:MAG: DUF1697 domain-containing protein [Allosphingosinicella sp.]|uniref:DUF1697 domain-containing protein n=1 Tax=Allosphingosinicella sp. TaxID=2823234 RepID=UPI00395DD07F
MRYVALLRAVNVGGCKLPMAELREVCAELGWEKVETYIQSGNVVFEATGKPEALETALEKAVAKRFGFERPVIVRSAKQWTDYAEGSPFPEAERDEPNRLMLGLSKLPPNADAPKLLEAKAAAGEQVRLKGDVLWIHYPAGAGTSKLTPALFDKAAGSPVTQRNWRTVLKLQEMLQA